MPFRETQLVLFTANLAGFARCTAQLRPLEVAGFISGWYRSIEAALGKNGGGLVKYMGDSCLATFPPEGSTSAVDAALHLVGHPPTGLDVQVGVKIHFGVVAEGEIGADRRYDIFGGAVNDLFRMGAAGAVLISDPVYQLLPAEYRTRWHRHPVLALHALVR